MNPSDALVIRGTVERWAQARGTDAECVAGEDLMRVRTGAINGRDDWIDVGLAAKDGRLRVRLVIAAGHVEIREVQSASLTDFLEKEVLEILESWDAFFVFGPGSGH